MKTVASRFAFVGFTLGSGCLAYSATAADLTPRLPGESAYDCAFRLTQIRPAAQRAIEVSCHCGGGESRYDQEGCSKGMDEGRIAYNKAKAEKRRPASTHETRRPASLSQAAQPENSEPVPSTDDKSQQADPADVAKKALGAIFKGW